MSSFSAGRGNDAMLQTNVNTSQNDTMNNPTYAVPNQLVADRAVYEELPSEGVTVHALAAFTGDGRYNKLKRDSSLVTQSMAPSITGNDNVEAYYGRLDNSEQYAVSAWYMCCDAVIYKHHPLEG